MNTKFQIIRHMLGYSASGIVSGAIVLITNFYVASLLGPTDFGILNAVSLVLVYGAYLEFGSISTMGRDLPYHLGRGDMEKAAVIEGAARSMTIFGAFVAALIVIAYSFLPINSPKMAMGLRAMAIVLILQNVYTYHKTVLRSHNNFRELSLQLVFSALVALVLTIPFIIYLGFDGRLIALILAQTVIVIYALLKNPWKAVPQINASEIWSVMRVGLPITLSGFVLSLLATIDRLMVINFLGNEKLGYFGLAILLTVVLTIIPTMAIQVLYPRITHQFGSSGDNLASLRVFVLTPPTILSTLLPILIGPLYLFLPSFLSMLLPDYMPGITAARIVIVGIFFFGIIGLMDYFLVTIGKLKECVLFACIALVFKVVLNYSFIYMGYDIEGVAVGGTLITYFLYSCIVIGYALSHYTKRLSDWVRFFAKLWLPFIYMILLLWFVNMAINKMLPLTTSMELLFSTSVKLLFYMLCYAPLMYLVFRNMKPEFSKLGLIK